MSAQDENTTAAAPRPSAAEAAEEKKMAKEDPVKKIEKKATVKEPVKPPASPKKITISPAKPGTKPPKVDVKKHIKPASDEDEEAPPQRATKRSPPIAINAAAVPPKRKPCTYIGAKGIACTHTSNLPDAEGRCCHHRGSVSFKKCMVRDCGNWTRNKAVICSVCKARTMSMANRTLRAEKRAEGLEYVRSLESLSEAEREQILHYFGAETPAEPASDAEEEGSAASDN